MRRLMLLFLVLAVPAAHPAETPAATKTVRLPGDAAGEWIGAVAFSPDGKAIAGGTSANRIVLWDLTSGKELYRVTPHEEEKSCRCRFLVFSADGKKLATVHDSGVRGPGRARIHIWEIAGTYQLRQARSFRADAVGRYTGVWQVALSPDGKMLATGEPTGTVCLWDADTGRERLRFHGGVAAAFTPDGSSLVSLSHDGRIHRWAAGTNRLLAPTQEARQTDFIHVDRVAFAPSGRLVAVSDGYTTWLKDMATGRTVRRLAFPYAVVPLAFSADNQTLAAAARGGISLLDTVTGKQLDWLPGNGVGAFSGVGRHLAWSDGRSILVEEMPVLGSGRPHPPPPASDPAEVPLRAELLVNRDSYVLDLGGLTAEEFSEEIRSGYPPTPLVDLALRLHNVGDKPLTVQRGGDLTCPTFVLVGRGAVNVAEVDLQTGVGAMDGSAEPITLAPGASHTCRITTLGDSNRSYWILPGEYTLYAQCHGAVSPAVKGAGEGGDVWVSLRCPPVKLKVLPAGNRSADPLERPRKVSALGALVAREDEETAELKDKLGCPVNPAGIRDGALTLPEVVEYLGQRYDLKFHIDEAAFRKVGKDYIREATPHAALPIGVTLSAVLHTMLEPLDAGYEIRQRGIWIVPLPQPQSLAERLAPAAPSLLRKLHHPITLKSGIHKATPLAKALQDLSRSFDLIILIDHRAFERAAVKDVGQRPVLLAEQVNVRLSLVLRQLLRQADATFVARQNIVLIVPRGQ